MLLASVYLPRLFGLVVVVSLARGRMESGVLKLHFIKGEKISRRRYVAFAQGARALSGDEMSSINV